MSLRVRTGILVALIAAFLVYSITLYTRAIAVNEAVADGRLVWQKYNCQACHQLYGLGGYLGPDLTNICSAPGKGDVYISALIQSGTRQMPAFQLNEDEMKALLGFLRGVDQTGDGRMTAFNKQWNGMIQESHE